jgi:hypothetical protein
MTSHSKLNFRLRSSAWAVASSSGACGCAFGYAEAAGLGQGSMSSPLSVSLCGPKVEVFATREELSGMKAQLASQDAFKQAGVDYTPTLSGITLSTVDKRSERSADHQAEFRPGRSTIRLSICCLNSTGQVRPLDSRVYLSCSIRPSSLPRTPLRHRAIVRPSRQPSVAEARTARGPAASGGIARPRASEQPPKPRLGWWHL